MQVESFAEIINKANSLTETPEIYLSGRQDVCSDVKELTKRLYDFNKHHEPDSRSHSEALHELVVEQLDEEQIWQQIQLENNFVWRQFVSDIAQFLVNKNNLSLVKDAHEESSDTSEKGEENESGFSDDSNQGESGNEPSLKSSHDEEGEEEDGNEDAFNIKRLSVVDDAFFKLHEMEHFLEKQENEKHNDSEDDFIDYFEHFSDSNDEERPLYSDFFDQPEESSNKKRKKSNSEHTNVDPSKKRVKFLLQNAADDKVNSSDDDDDDDDDQNEIISQKSISTFEARQQRLKSRIRALEEEALKEKPWQLKGEVTASSRPQNSLLEEYVEFDTAVRPPPAMTEKTTLKLEDVIKQRIRDKTWDDVERKIKPVQDPREFKKRLVLNQEKSKLSLAQIYEQEYLKQKENESENSKDKPDQVPDEHLEIDGMMNDLFTKLDALSNFHFTPKMVSTQVKIVSNLPAVTVEEVAPVATSDAALLAPEEIKPKMKANLLGETERTKTDKKRERRLKKKKQKLRQKELEKRQKPKGEKENDFSKRGKKMSKKLSKKFGRNVSQIDEIGDGKYVRSSNAFFAKLQDQVRSQVKRKSADLKTLEKNKKLDIKRLKL